MLEPSVRQAILELQRCGQSVRAIARALHVSRAAVREVLRRGSAEVPQLARPEKALAHREDILRLLQECRRTCKNAEITTGRRHCLMSVGTGPAQTGHGTLIVALDASGLICRGVRPTAGARWTGRHRMHKQLMGQILRHVRNPALSDDRRQYRCYSGAPRATLPARH